MKQTKMPSEARDEAALDQDTMLGLIGYNCRRAFLAVEPFSHPRMAAYQLRPSDFAVLSLLRANPNISHKRVAEGIEVSAPNLAPVLDRLEARQLLTRERHARDKRMQTLALTEAGLQLCTQAEQTATELETESTAMLSPPERQLLIRLLQKIYLK